jgi:hypothetical protein
MKRMASSVGQQEIAKNFFNSAIWSRLISDTWSPGNLAGLPQFDGRIAFLRARVTRQSSLTLLTVEGFEHFVGAQRLIPVDVARVIGILGAAGSRLWP